MRALISATPLPPQKAEELIRILGADAFDRMRTQFELLETYLRRSRSGNGKAWSRKRNQVRGAFYRFVRLATQLPRHEQRQVIEDLEAIGLTESLRRQLWVYLTLFLAGRSLPSHSLTGRDKRRVSRVVALVVAHNLRSEGFALTPNDGGIFSEVLSTLLHGESAEDVRYLLAFAIRLGPLTPPLDLEFKEGEDMN